MKFTSIITGNSSEQILSAPDKNQTQNNSNIKWQSIERVWDIDWTLILHELKEWQAPWNYMTLWEFSKAWTSLLLEKELQ